MPPSNNVITSFLSTLIGQPHFGAEGSEGPRNASIVTRRTFPYVRGWGGWARDYLGKGLVTDFLVQQNGGVLECERANQIEFSYITTRNDHVTA